MRIQAIGKKARQVKRLLESARKDLGYDAIGPDPGQFNILDLVLDNTGWSTDEARLVVIHAGLGGLLKNR